MKAACLVVSHNFPSLTDSLVETIRALDISNSADIYVIETGSNLEKLSKYTSLWVSEGVRMTRGWNILHDYARRLGNLSTPYTHYMLYVNDAKPGDHPDYIRELMLQADRAEAPVIHPYRSDMGGAHGKKEGLATRPESFFEIVSPMIKASFWDTEINLLDDIFYYGWGLDYDIPHKVHRAGHRIHISNTVSVSHTAFTSYTNAEMTEEKLSQPQFMSEARKNMYEGMIARYGERWPEVITASIPEDVDGSALRDWIRINEAPYLRHYGIVI